MIPVKQIWLAVNPLDMRCGADKALARVVQDFGYGTIMVMIEQLPKNLDELDADTLRALLRQSHIRHVKQSEVIKNKEQELSKTQSVAKLKDLAPKAQAKLGSIQFTSAKIYSAAT